MHCNSIQQNSMNHSELIKGTLGTIILRLLEEKGRLYGYEITQLVKEMSDSKILIKEGSLYPALHKLEADGLVVTEEVYIGKRVRKYYKLTEPGQKATTKSVDELMEFINTIHQLILPKQVITYELAN